MTLLVFVLGSLVALLLVLLFAAVYCNKNMEDDLESARTTWDAGASYFREKYRESAAEVERLTAKLDEIHALTESRRPKDDK